MNQPVNPAKANIASDSGTIRRVNVHWESAASGNQYQELVSSLRLLVHSSDFLQGQFRWNTRITFETESGSTLAMAAAATDDSELPVGQHGSWRETVPVYVLYFERDTHAVSRNVDTGLEFAISITHARTDGAWIDEIEQELVSGRAQHPLVVDFERGVPNEPPPSPIAVSMAERLVQSAESKAKYSEITVDVDGGMSFTIVAIDGTLISGEYTARGELYAWHYEPDWSTQQAEIFQERDISNLLNWLG